MSGSAKAVGKLGFALLKQIQKKTGKSDLASSLASALRRSDDDLASLSKLNCAGTENRSGFGIYNSSNTKCKIGEITDSAISGRWVVSELPTNHFEIAEAVKALRKLNPEKRRQKLAYDPDTNEMNFLEADTAFEIEERFGYFIRYEKTSGAKGDYMSLSGPYAGKTFDVTK